MSGTWGGGGRIKNKFTITGGNGRGMTPFVKCKRRGENVAWIVKGSVGPSAPTAG
jgi:hypothetical protein